MDMGKDDINIKTPEPASKRPSELAAPTPKKVTAIPHNSQNRARPKKQPQNTSAKKALVLDTQNEEHRKIEAQLRTTLESIGDGFFGIVFWATRCQKCDYNH